MKYARIFFFLFLLSKSAYPQADNAVQQVFIVGNTGSHGRTSNLQQLSSVIRDQQGPVTMIYCGDIMDEKEKVPSAADTALIKSLLEIAAGDSGIHIYFVPGDLEWNNSGKDGWKHVKNLEKLVNGLAGKQVFLPGSGCPGPEVISVSNDLQIVLINTPWLLHPYDRPYAPDDDCKIMVEEQFIEELDEVIEEAKDKHLLVVGHHPVLSNGIYGGRMRFTQYLFPPVLGSFINGYHQNIGSPKDLAYPSYKRFSGVMKTLMENHEPFIYASAHENDLQVLRYEDSYQVISGSLFTKAKTHRSTNTVYKSDRNGFISLSYYSNGKVVMTSYEIGKGAEIKKVSEELYQSDCEEHQAEGIINTRLNPCNKVDTVARTTSASNQEYGVAVAGKEYKAGLFKKIFLGSLYRKSWATQVSVPYLNLDTTKGGLTATGIGGGRQTQSLSLSGADGKSYVFRSVDKDPIKALNTRLRKTFVAGLARQFTATQNPYGALPVSYLLDSTSILHAPPALYIMPSDPKLGIHQKEFGGMLGMLEEKPKKKQGENSGTFHADEIVRSFELFRKLYKDNDNRVDEKSFLEARIFDMWIGDWGRHEDNWKWAGYKHDKKTVFKPIPRDRDHAFSLWNGLLPYLANRQWAMPNVESFEKKFKDIKSLTYPARHLDRFLLTSLSKDDWTAIATRIKNSFPDQVIDSAIQQFPKEVIPVSGNKIGVKLKSRREKLIPAAMEYYKILAKKVNVVGSNKAENFEIIRQPDNSVSVTVRDIKSGKPADTAFYHRVFFPDETDYINVYGLDGDDVFSISGSSKKSVHVRIFGGKGNDSITNTSEVIHGRKLTRIYDYESGKNFIEKGQKSKIVLSDNRLLVDFNRQPVHYDSYLPLPLIYYTPEDGIAAGLGLLYFFHRFGEDGYANKFKVTDRVSTQGNVQIKISDEFHHLIGKWDLLLDAELGQPYPTTYYYGAGNETVKLKSVPKENYQSHIYGYSLFSGFQRVFWKKSSFNLGLIYERNNATVENGNFLHNDQDLLGLEDLDYAGPSSSLEIDFRDNALIPKQGARFFASQNYLHYNISDRKDFATTKVSMEFYQTRSFIVPLTLGLKGTFCNSAGDIPFYKLNTLGRTTGLRGFSRDRFSGRMSAVFNSQLAAEFGTVKTVIAPLTFGMYGFYDLGRVWVPEETSDKLHAGYGAGIYFTPLFEILTTRVSISFSEESPKGIIEAGLGIGF